MNPSRRSPARPAAALAALAFAASACFGGGSDDEAGSTTDQQANAGPPQPGGVYRMSTPSEPATLDPHDQAAARTHAAIGYSYSKLVDFKTGPDVPYGSDELEGDLAESWESSADGLTWTFQLRQGVTFHDVAPVNGREFTSADVVCTMDRIRDLPGQQSHLISMAQSWEAPDDHTVVFHLAEPYAAFDQNLAGHFMWILPCEGTQGQYDLETTVIGTGPFVLDSWVRDQERIYLKNPDYYDEGKPYLDEIQVSIVPEEGSRIAAFRTNELDTVDSIADQAQIDLVSSSVEGVIVQEELSYSPEMVYMNQTQPPFDDVRVRQAVAMAVDRENMLDSLRPGEESGGLLSGPVTPKLFGGLPPEDAAELTPYDPDAAKQLLADAGYADGFATTMLITDGYGPVVASEAQWVQQDLAEIGIEVELDVQDYATYISQSWPQKDYAMGYGPQTPMLSADEYLTSMYLSTGSRNWFGIDDPELDQMILDQRGILDENERETALLDIQKYIVENVANPANLYIPNAVTFYQPYVHDVYPHPEYGSRHMKDVWIDADAPGRA